MNTKDHEPQILPRVKLHNFKNTGNLEVLIREKSGTLRAAAFLSVRHVFSHPVQTRFLSKELLSMYQIAPYYMSLMSTNIFEIINEAQYWVISLGNQICVSLLESKLAQCGASKRTLIQIHESQRFGALLNQEKEGTKKIRKINPQMVTQTFLV